MAYEIRQNLIHFLTFVTFFLLMFNILLHVTLLMHPIIISELLCLETAPQLSHRLDVNPLIALVNKDD